MERYNERIGLVVRSAEKIVAIKRADEEGLSLAAYLRRLIRKDASAAGQWPPSPTKQESARERA